MKFYSFNSLLTNKIRMFHNFDNALLAACEDSKKAFFTSPIEFDHWEKVNDYFVLLYFRRTDTNDINPYGLIRTEETED